MPSGRFTVDWSVEKTSGKFASKDEIEEELREAIDSANPNSISPGEGEYDVTDWNVEVDDSKPVKVTKPTRVVTSGAVPQPAPIVALIRAYVRLEHFSSLGEAAEAAAVNKATDELTEALDALCEHLPRVTEQERAKLAN